jgi:hypothetical protein
LANAGFGAGKAGFQEGEEVVGGDFILEFLLEDGELFGVEGGIFEIGEEAIDGFGDVTDVKADGR